MSAEQRKRLTKVALAGGLTVTAALGLALIARGKVGGGLSPASLRAPIPPPALPGRTFKALPSRSSAPTEDELDTLEAYIFSSRNLNRSLRSGKTGAGISKDVTTIDSWMSNTQAKDGRYWRGIASEREAAFLRNASAGQTYTDAGYGSFSSSLKTAQQFAEEHTANTERVIVRVRAAFHPMPTEAIDDLARRRGYFEESSGGEREFLAPRNAQYRVKRVRSGVTLNPGNIPGRQIWSNRTYTIVDVDYLGKDPTRSVTGRGKPVARAKPRASMLRRIDASEGRQGKPCGESYIPRTHKCSKNTGPLTAGNLKTAAKVALAVGALAGGAYLTKRGMMSMDEWRKSPQSARNNPKLSPEKAQQIADEAIAGGQKWDVQEKINARRQAELNIECGIGLGKILAPAKFDAAIPNPRCQAGEGSFGTYFVHTSQKYGVKLFRGDEDDVGFEFDMLDRARAAGVNAPEPLAMNAVRDMDGEIRAQTLVLSHMKGYKELGSAYRNSYGNADKAPLITQIKIAREFRKLHTEGLAHGDIHAGNIMVNTVSKKPAIVDFGYATDLDSYHPGHGRSGIQNLMRDLNRLPEFFGLPARGDEFLARYKGVLDNIETQATNWDKGVDRSQSWDRFEIGVKRYHDALEAELLWEDRKPRSRFISGADQPRIPGLTRGILAANVNTAQREIAELQLARGHRPSFLNSMAKGLGVKPARLQGALQPERDARLAKQRRQPYGTPIPVPPPTPKPKKTPVGMFRVRPGTPTGMRRVKPGVDEFTGAATTPKGLTPRRLSLAARMQRIMERSGNESMSLEAALRQARNEQRGFSSWKD